MVLLCVGLGPLGLTHAQAPDEEAEPTPAGETTTAQIFELALLLEDRQTYEQGIEQLMALRDTRVKVLFERMMDRSLYEYEDSELGYIFVPNPEEGQDRPDVVRAFEPLGDEPILANGQPLEIAYREIRRDQFTGHRRARRDILSALALVDLVVDDVEVRLEAAERVGDRREAEALPTLLEMAESDPDAEVRWVARESALLIQLNGSAEETTEAEQIAAAEELGELKSLRAYILLEKLLEEATFEGAEPLSDEAEAAYTQALSKIEGYRTRLEWTQHIFRGLSLGSILVLIALGLAITFGLMGVINMAHGEMLMIGAVSTWAAYEFIGTELPAAWFNWYYVAALPMAFLISAGVGLAVEWLVVRHLYKRPLDSLLATIGVSLILIQAVRMWKGDNLGMSAPTWLQGSVAITRDLELPKNRVFVMIVSLVCVMLFGGLLRFTRYGLLVRATVQNREMAQSLGVNTRKIDAMTFALGAGLAGVAGWAYTVISNVTPDMGQKVIVDSFLVVVAGGVGKLIGVVVSGLSVGLLQKLTEPVQLDFMPFHFFDATWSKVFALIVVIVFMQFRPAGLFPDKGRLADA